MKKFKIFFDIIDNHTCAYMHIKKNFKIFHFLAKFLNFLEGPPTKIFPNWFFSTTVHSQTKFHIVSGWFLTFGLDLLPRELCVGKKTVYDDFCRIPNDPKVLYFEFFNRYVMIFVISQNT